MTTVGTVPEHAATLADELLAVVGERGLLTRADVETRSCDPFSHVPIASPYVVRPSTTGQVADVVRVCRRRGVSIVMHGGVTGVCGGAFADADSIVLSLERMNRVEEISTVDEVAVVEAGVIVEALHDAAAEHDLFYPIDLGAKGSATIGGTLATNAGGNHVLRWGMTRANVLGIEAVLADGTIVSAMNRMIKNNTGYDLKQLLIGSEGTLGIITRAVLKLVPAPTTQEVAFVAAQGMREVISLLKLARRLPSLSAFEVMWADYYELMAASGSGRRPLEPGYPYYVLIETMGYDEQTDADRFARFIEAATEQGLIADGVLAHSERQKRELWHVREGSEIIVREFKRIASFDVSVPLSDMESFTHAVNEALRAQFSGVRITTFGHLGDNNIHFGISIGDDTRERTVEIERVVFGVLERYPGALTAEHGVGQLKREFLPRHKHPGEMAMMRALRDALDPDRRFNPDVLF
jgi:FAD/FMN-containing dehydrogenase